jgi:hypothetical protein
MKRDYLWDGSGRPDPEVEKLEKLLAPLRYDRPAPDFEFQPHPVRRSRRWLSLGWRPAWAFASVLVVALAVWWFFRARPYYEVLRLEGSPQVGAARLNATGRLQIGQWLTTDSSSRARIHVASLGDVDIDPNTRIQLVEARETEHRLLLQRGVLHARIWAPPRSFFVNTPFAQAVDLGCTYTLEVDDDGTGVLRVTSGWVALEHQGRESFVPAGAMCLTHPGVGPGTPYRSDASSRLQTALEKVDWGFDSRAAALAVVLSEARKEDSFTLWHLLACSSGAERLLVYDRLAQLVPPPAGVTREGVLRSNRGMLDLWWDELGLGNTEWWRLWERSWPERR